MIRFNAQTRLPGGNWRNVGRVVGGFVVSDKHGFKSARVEVYGFAAEARAAYALDIPLEVRVSYGVWPVFEGDLSKMYPGSMSTTFECFGPWDALRNHPYTSLWIHENIGDYKAFTELNGSAFKSEQFDIRVGGNEIIIGLKKDHTYDGSNTIGFAGYLVPSNSRQAQEITFDVDSNLSSDYEIGLDKFSNSGGYGGSGTHTNVWSYGSGSYNATVTQSSMNVPEPGGVGFYVKRKTNGTYTGDTEDARLRITAVSLTGFDTSAAAADIIKDIISYHASDDSPRLSSDVSYIEDGATLSGTTIYRESDPRQVIEALEALGDGSQEYYAAIWEDRRLVFQPVTSYGRTWGLSSSDIDLSRDFTGAATSVRASYADPHNSSHFLTGTTKEDEERLALWMYSRTHNLETSVTDSAAADAQAEAKLSDLTSSPKFTIRARYMRQYPSGSPIPAAYVRALDRVRLLSMATAVSSDVVDVIVGESRLDLKTGIVDIVPLKRPDNFIQHLRRPSSSPTSVRGVGRRSAIAL